MRLPLLLIALLATATATATATAAEWKMDAAASTLSFSSSYLGDAFEGRFERFEADIDFTPGAAPSGRFDVRIELASANTDNEERDQTLATDEFFDSGSQPEATWVAEDFEYLGDDRYIANGVLTLRGSSHPVPLSFTWTEAGEQATLDGSAAVERLRFGVGTGDWADADTIGHNVDVRTQLQLIR